MNYICPDSVFYLIDVFVGAKVMIVGSKLDDVLAVSIPTKQELQDEAASGSSKEPASQQKMHRKVLDKGIPEDAMPGILEAKVRFYSAFFFLDSIIYHAIAAMLIVKVEFHYSEH